MPDWACLRHHSGRVLRAPLLISAAVLLVAGPASAAVVPGRIVLQSGDPIGGTMVTDVGHPFVNAAGEVAFVGNLDDGDHYVFVGNASVWLGSDDAMATLDAIEQTMDTDGAGHFVYAPDVDGLDGVYTDAGVLAVVGQPAVGFPMGATYTFHASPSMNADGAIYWVAGIDTSGDMNTDARAFYRTLDGTPASTELLLASGDMVGGLTLDAFGIELEYMLSEDGAHGIQMLNATGDIASDDFVWVDGAIVARELDPNGTFDNWDNFDIVAINANGHYLFTGDTDGVTETDEFMAYDATIVVREGDVLAGVPLLGPATMRFVALSDFDQAAYGWAYVTPTGTHETVFFACSAADIVGTTQVVFTTFDDELDVDGDGAGDFTITDLALNTPTPTRAMGNTPFVYVELVLDDGMSQREAMVEIPVSCCGNGVVDPFEDCDDANGDDTDDCPGTCLAATCGDGFVQAGVEDCDDGNDDDTDDCPGTCAAATCGDGFVQAGVEDCDDGNDDDTDDCPGTCAAATCGDGFVQDGVEECDDGNTEDDDGCLTDCTLPASGSTGGDATAGDTGLDDTGTGGGGSGTGAGPGSGPVTVSASAANDDSSGGETETGGAIDPVDGCSCRADGRGPAPWSGLGLLMLGWRGRRRRRSGW
ncbi:DUF4215 domain-containing protein [Paraliomyxa miuraensis]|uniref:DUF4215 domain-containing protein n=1 Tax=Paraliomyxa miuraensis TaxID=376150 RepID=UPI00224F0CE1|nr:DUF4215 domain-containing protein [Paraliomyxa miuraensis]MCX4247504.1 DUF4215 domain-containing protein [Paraliomyxa miuraensis]